MGKIAFVFSGQGAQNTGMGRDVFDASEKARAVFALADRLRPGTSQQCFRASKEELSITSNTQPCLFTVDLAAAAALSGMGIRPAAVAGFSLGEIAALGFAGAMSYETAFRLVCARAEYMQEAAEETEGAMSAVLGLASEQVETLSQSFSSVQPVNYNCPGQIVVAGTKEELADFAKLAKESGGKVRPLAVSGAFHSRYMDGAAKRLGGYLDTVEMRLPELPVYANVTGRPYADPCKKLTEEQVNHPVRWQETIENMAADGIDTFIETGAGKVLCGLISRIVPEARVLHYQDMLQNPEGCTERE